MTCISILLCITKMQYFLAFRQFPEYWKVVGMVTFSRPGKYSSQPRNYRTIGLHDPSKLANDLN